MAIYPTIEELIDQINAYIYDNGAQAITGLGLQDILDSIVNTLDSLKADSTALSLEARTRELADQNLARDIAGKQAIIPDLNDIRAGAAAGATAYQKPSGGIPAADLAQAVQNALSKANTAYQLPSGGVPKTDLAQAVQNSLSLADSAIQSLSPVTDLIPAAASTTNQLADKAFVNSSIATNTAYYISDNGQPFQSVADLEAYSGPLTNNDYAFVVGTDQEGNTTYTRYKYNAQTQVWGAEYVLNNSSFTAVQWAAINSGITADLVVAFGGKYTKPSGGIPASDLAQAVQDALTAAGTAYQKPGTGIPAADMAQAVQNALTAAGTAVQPSDLAGYEQKMAIVADATGPAALAAQIGKYHRLDTAVGTLAITLPAVSDTGFLQSLIISLATGANPAVTFASADSKTIEYFDGFQIEANKSYEINCLFNGAKWIVAYGIIA